MTTLSWLEVHRVAGMASSALNLAQCVDSELLRRAANEIEAKAQASVTVCDEIFGAVPSVDQHGRRALLALRRRIHAGRRLSNEECEFLAQWIKRGAVTSLQTAQDVVDATHQNLIEAIESDNDAARELITFALQQDEVARGLAVVAPGFASIAGVRHRLGSKNARTALSFVIRAALKPSPLSTLTGVAVPGIRFRPSRATAPSELAYLLLEAAAIHPTHAAALQFVPAPLVCGMAGVRVLIRESVISDDRVGSRDRTVDLRSYADDIRRIARWGGGGYESLIRNAGGRDPNARARRWILLGLVRPVVPWATGSASPWTALADALGSSVVSSSLREIPHLADRISSATTAQRLGLVAELSNRLDEIFSVMSSRRPLGRVVNEDAAATSTLSRAQFSAELQSVGLAVRHRLHRSRVYDLLVKTFVDRYGEGGVCPNAAEFLIECAGSRSLNAEIAAARRADSVWASDGAPDRRDRLAVGKTSAPPTLAVMYQEITEEDQSGGKIVLNQFANGMGGMLARFAHLEAGETHKYKSALCDWVRQCFPDVVEVYEFIPDSEVSSLQMESAGVLPSITWPTRSSTGSEQLCFSDLQLAHDAELGVLEFLGRDGSLVAIVNLGIVPAWTLSGGASLALVLMDPWAEATSLSRSNNPLIRASTVRSEPPFLERDVRSGVVFRRRTWHVPSDEFPRPSTSIDVAEFLLALDGWRLFRGLPNEAFIWIIGDDPLDSARRKPLWIQFASWYSVSSILPLLERSHTIRFQEVLPARLTVGGVGGPRVTERVRLLRWERPTQIVDAR